MNAYEQSIKNLIPKYTDKIDAAMEAIYKFLLSSDECQFNMTQLMEILKDFDVIPSENTIKNRLKSKFGDQIVISSRMGGTMYICFSKNVYNILTDAWYNSRAKTIEE